MSFLSFATRYQKLHALFHFAGIAVADQAMVSGINFLVAIVLARLLGVAAFGQFSLVLILVFFCLEVQRALITAPMMHRVATGTVTGYFQRLVHMQWLLAIILAAGAGAFIWVSGWLFPKWQIQSLATAAGFLILFRLTQEFMRRFLFVTDKKSMAIIMDGVICVAVILFLVLLYMNGVLSIETAIVAHMFAYAISVLFFVQLTKAQSGSVAEHHRAFITGHWNFGGWLLAAVIVTYASSNLLVMMGGAIIGPEAAGLVKAAQYMMGGMIVMFQAIENILPFHMTKLAHKGEKAALYLFTLKSTAAMMLFCGVHGAVVLYFVEPLSHWLAPGFGNDMKHIVIGCVIQSLIMVTGYHLQYLLRANNRTKPIFYANAVTAVLSLIMGKPLVEHYGALGIVCGLIAVNIIAQMVYLSALVSDRKRGTA